MALPTSPAGTATRPKDLEKVQIAELLRGYSLELAPRGELELDHYRAVLPPGQTVYVASVAGRPLAPTIATAAGLRRNGFNPVPHIAARRMASAAALENFLARLHGEAGVDDVLVVAGDEPKPLGPFADSAALLESGLLARHGIRRVGIAGYPGGHPRIAADALRAALPRKVAAAREAGLEPRIVTQFCFEPDRIVAWTRQTSRELDGVPIHIGLAGVAGRATLLKFAQRCGVTASLRMLRSHRKALIELISTATPAEAIAALAAERAKENGFRPAGLHLFPFGGVERTVQWAGAVLRGEFEIASDGRGLDVLRF